MSMARNLSKKCPCCGTLVKVVEHTIGVPGGREREKADCPICGEVLFSSMTDGWFETSVISMDETIEQYKAYHQ